MIACGDDSTTGGGGSGATGGTSSDGGSGGTTSDGGNPSNGGGGSTSDGGSPATGGGGGGTGGAGPECDPMGNDTACIACARQSCCTQVTECFGDATCTACAACVQAAADPATCLNSPDCDISNPQTARLFACANDSCNADCFNGQSLCEPAKGDDPCFACVKQDTADGGCCPELEACSTDPECVQCLGCIQQNPDNPIVCAGNGSCQLADQETSDFVSCARGMNPGCGDVCG